MDIRSTAVIIALDGTLLDNSSIRHLLAGHDRDFDCPATGDYVARSLLCPPDARMLQLALLEQALGHRVFILTSRPSQYRAAVELWLGRHGLIADGILMSADRNLSTDTELKAAMAAAILADHDIVHAYDDDPGVVDAYNGLGISSTHCMPAGTARVPAAAASLR
ncbi:MAG TPA: hypothetical protein VF867_19270 [Arthrobacter sp.]